jgi:cytochrome c oxidase subunit 2
VRRLAAAAGLLVAAAVAAPAAAALPFWMKLPEGVSSYSDRIDGIFRLILWITGVIFVVVELLLIFFLVRYRHREGRRARYTHGSNRLEVIWTIVPAVICVILALVSRRTWADIKQSLPKDALAIEITAEQFAWNIRYPGPDGRFGTADDVASLNQLHFPVGRPVVATLRSKDVIHSFFLPEFRVKQDAVPGMSTRIWFDATRAGQWEIACAELCGLGHYRMKGFVTVEPQEDFEKWLATQAAEASGTPPVATQAPPASVPPGSAPAPGPPATPPPQPTPVVPAASVPQVTPTSASPNAAPPASTPGAQEGQHRP